MAVINRISTPKTSGSSRSTGRSRFYDYYAGYSDSFAHDVIRSLNLCPDSIVLDPWNGSGTTTYAAGCLGLKAVGLDINPSMTLVAKARMCGNSQFRRLDKVSDLLIDDLELCEWQQSTTNDPLTQWFDNETTARFRALQSRLGLVVRENTNVSSYVESLSIFKCLKYVSLFKLVRLLTKRFESSNPTWVRLAKSNQDRINYSSVEILTAYRSVISDMYRPTYYIAPNVKKAISIYCKDARNVHKLVNKRVQSIVTSPPYCTRIDYPVKTRRELAILGISDDTSFRNLREESIGTPLIVSNNLAIQEKWGPTCVDFLEKVLTHESKASATYYYNVHLQYFDSLYTILNRSFRLLTENGRCAIVVQGSYYKEILNDLPQIVVEMVAGIGGWTLSDKIEYRSPSRYRHNPHARKRHSLRATAEHILIFK